MNMIVQLLELTPILSLSRKESSLGQRIEGRYRHSTPILPGFYTWTTIGLDINIKAYHPAVSPRAKMEIGKGASAYSLTSHDLDEVLMGIL